MAQPESFGLPKPRACPERQCWPQPQAWKALAATAWTRHGFDTKPGMSLEFMPPSFVIHFLCWLSHQLFRMRTKCPPRKEDYCVRSYTCLPPLTIKKMKWLLYRADNPKHILKRVLRSPKTKAELKYLPQGQRNPQKYHCNYVPR